VKQVGFKPGVKESELWMSRVVNRKIKKWSRKSRNCYQNEVDENIQGVDSRDKVKHNERRN